MIIRQIAGGPPRRRVGILPEGRAPAREGTEIVDAAGKKIGIVTSGGFAPSLNRPIAMGYVGREHAEAGARVGLMVRGKALPAEIVKMPSVDPHFGPAFRDQPILAVERVCYAGDPVVAVAAVDRRTAEDALQLVEVDYEALPAVHDVLEAVKPDSPLVHEQHRPAKAFADLAHVQAGRQSNICYHFKLRTGDVDKAFAEADRLFEDTFSSPPAQHLPMEPHVTLAYFDEHERLNIWTASQSPSYVRTEIAATFGIPMNRIRVRVPYIGGGYGAKLYAKLEPLCTVLALVTQRPVRYALTRLPLNS